MSSFSMRHQENNSLLLLLDKKNDGQFVNYVNTMMNQKKDVSIVDVIYLIRSKIPGVIVHLINGYRMMKNGRVLTMIN